MSRPASGSEPNPLLSDRLPIPFDAVHADHVRPAIDAVLADAERVLEEIGAARPSYRYDDLLGAIDRASARVGRVVSTVAALNAVRQSPELREAVGEAMPRVAAFGARQAADPDVYRVLGAYAESAEAAELPPERARFLEVELDERRRAGAALDAEARARAVELRSELARLGHEFQNHLLDGVAVGHVDVTDERRLAGIPDAPRRRAREAAERAETDGWRFSLQQPQVVAVLDHAEDRELRREMYAAQQAVGTGEGRDNRTLIPRILHARRELAHVLGHVHWADLQTEDRMAKRGASAYAFERDLWRRVEPHFRNEVEELDAFARDRLGYDRLEPWDVRFVSERLRRARFDLDEEALRPYFPLDAVLDGVFGLARELFGIEIRPVRDVPVWHEDVRTYEAHDRDGRRVGLFYTDWHPRDEKRSGAWKAALINGGPTDDGGFEPHVALVAGNLAPGEGGRPALLTHDEARTVFHEFGHLLHQLASTVTVRSLAGTQVAWDFVELPSQILENWLYEDAALVRWARHVDDGRTLPQEDRRRLRAARTFGAAYHMARQISFGTVDLALHVDWDPDGDEDPISFGRRTLAPFQIRPDVAQDGFLPAFAHVFSGPYSAGYYSYLWSEMLDADAFGRFRDAGLFDAATGEAFRAHVLSRGNAEPPERLIRVFLGRDPDPEALLIRNLGPERAAAADAAD